MTAREIAIDELTRRPFLAIQGSTSTYGIVIPNYPNFFMILGPQCAFANIPPVIETQVEFISDLIGEAESRGKIVDASSAAEKEWGTVCQTVADATLYSKQESWIFGANIEGKKRGTLFYMAGNGAYREYLKKVKEENWRGIEFVDA